VNEQEQDRYQAELRRTAPARLPEDFRARLRAAKPAHLFSVAQTSKSAVSRVSKLVDRHAAAPTRKEAITAALIAFGAALRSIYSSALNGNKPKAGRAGRWHPWRWLAPALVVAVVGLLLAERGTPAAAHPMKADDVRVDEELVSSFDVVAKLPGGEPVRFRCHKWRDQWSVTDTNRGLEIVQDSPRVEVVPVRFETY
jgi:hypothetical protein